MRRIAGAALGLVLLSSAVGCSGGSDDYCATLTDEKGTLDRLSGQAEGPSSDDLAAAVVVFERLHDAAPDDLRDEWATYVNAWEGLAESLDAAGVDADAFEDGEQPDGVDEPAYDAVRDAADKMRSRPVVEAAVGIEQHAADVCGVDLGGAGL